MANISNTDKSVVADRAALGQQPDFSTPTGTLPTGGGGGTVASVNGTANEITSTGGANPVIGLPSALTFTGKTVTGGAFTALASVNILGTGVFSASGSANAPIRHALVNTNNGSSAYTILDFGNDISATQLSIAVLSSSNTTYGSAGTALINVAGVFPIAFGTSNAVRLTITATGDTKISSGVDLQLGRAYVSGAVLATGTIALKDSSGTTYNVLVHT